MADHAFSEKTKILYIDDDTDLILIYSRFFKDSDYDFRTAFDAETGYEIAKEYKPDLIISDVALPGWTGIELCKKIREDLILRDTIFMLVSGIEVESDDISEGLTAGADDYLVKPFARDVIFSKIKAMLRIKKMQDELAYADRAIEDAVKKRDLMQKELEDVKEHLLKEKEILHNSLKQIALMIDERDKAQEEFQRVENLLCEERKHMIEILAELNESKPQYHRGHSRNVSEIAGAVARMMALSENEITDIETAGLLHELGKLSIPDDLALKNPVDYSQSEKDFLIQHPIKGAKMLGAFSGLENVSLIIRHIHEHVDGSGFPEGLKKDKIPVGAMIIAVVNAFDNMVYRLDKMSPEKALDTIESAIGKKYDSRVVNCLRRYSGRHAADNSGNTIELRLFEVKPGMRLAAGIYTLKGAKLLPEDIVLSEENIRQIARYNKVELLEDAVFIKE